MDPWSNIEISPDDPEIMHIDEVGGTLGSLPAPVLQIRKLIFGFEVCHFKYRQHMVYILDSIASLEPAKLPDDIGKSHLRHGDQAWVKDESGRSLSGFKYIFACRKWLGESERGRNLHADDKLYEDVKKWLGQREPEKERLLRLLIARLSWDWKSYEKLLVDNANKELESQVCRLDVCHYNFPHVMDSVLRGIGRLEPLAAFEGCGSFTSGIKASAESELRGIIDKIKMITSRADPDRSSLIKVWLYFCFAKVLKEQADLEQSLLGLYQEL